MKFYIILLSGIFALSALPGITHADSYGGAYCPGDNEVVPAGYVPRWVGYHPNPQTTCKAILHNDRFYLSSELSNEMVLIRRIDTCGRHFCGPEEYALYDEGSSLGTTRDFISVVPSAVARKYFQGTDAIATKDDTWAEISNVDPYPDLQDGMLYQFDRGNPNEPYRFFNSSTATSTAVTRGEVADFQKSLMAFSPIAELSFSASTTFVKSLDADLVPVINPVDRVDTTYTIVREADGRLTLQKTNSVTFFSDGTKNFESFEIATIQPSFWSKIMSFFKKLAV